ncbi:MAG: hypothetical protein IIY44_01365 [Erysipelotrichales bacterium]|nr:hypothetical protein [Erysipelotrichales bacterium]MBQ4374402.1 hypothetical protein [Erysipelotrichales bacterium]
MKKTITIITALLLLLCIPSTPVKATDDSWISIESTGSQYVTGSFMLNDTTYSYTFGIGTGPNNGGRTILYTSASVQRVHETVTVKYQTSSHGTVYSYGGYNDCGVKQGSTYSGYVYCYYSEPVSIKNISGYAWIYAQTSVHPYISAGPQ